MRLKVTMVFAPIYRNAVRRSRAYVWNSKQRNKLQEKSKQYCMFFNKFGKCSVRMCHGRNGKCRVFFMAVGCNCYEL